jgi:hypothetical protein
MLTLILTDSLNLVAHFEEQEVQELPVPVVFWFFANSIPNDAPLTSLVSTFSLVSPSFIRYESSLEGYPFTSNHPFWRKGSMERRNSPTNINYRPFANNNVLFEASNMRGIQIKQPFRVGERENQMLIELPPGRFINAKLSFAAQNENAADSILVDYKINTNDATWTSNEIAEPKRKLFQNYTFFEFNLSGAMDSVRLNNAVVRLRFRGGNLTEDVGNRVNFNNLAFDGSIITVMKSLSQSMATIAPNPAHQHAEVHTSSALKGWKLQTILGKTILEGSTYKLSLTQVPPGLYLVEISTEAGHTRQKLLVE